CPNGDGAATRERAEIGGRVDSNIPATAASDFQGVATPNQRTIDEICKFLGVGPAETVKTLVYLADGKAVAVLVRGDHEANEAKVRRAFGASTLIPAAPASTG